MDAAVAAKAASSIEKMGNQMGAKFETLPNLDHIRKELGQADPYLAFECDPSNVLLHRVDKENKVPGLFDFGREAIAK